MLFQVRKSDEKEKSEVKLPDMMKGSHSHPLFEPGELDFLNDDINLPEAVVNSFVDCLQEGMVEPELD